jgi:hypothetical protein
MLKQAKGAKMLTDEGWSNNAREARGLTGTKFSKNMKRLSRENKLKAEAARPLLELEKEFGSQPMTRAMTALGDATETILEVVGDTE